MNGGPSVIVNKGGFLAALVKGIFGTIMVVTLCATALGLYGMYVVASPAGAAIKEIARCLPDWQKAMPAVVSDAINDHRALEYESHIAVTPRVELVGSARDQAVVIIELKNNGPEVVSYLTLRVNVEDESEARLCTLSFAGASPLQIGDAWPGPLLPGHTKLLARCIDEVVGQPRLTVEFTDLRVGSAPAAVLATKELSDPRTQPPTEGRAAQRQDSN